MKIKLKQKLTISLLTLFLSPLSQAGMSDDPLLTKFMLDKLETSDEDGHAPLNWELDAWIGKDFNKLWFKSQGERIDGITEQRNELLFNHAVSAFWDVQVGYRQDRADGSDRDFLSIGAKGLLPYLIETDASIVFGEHDQIGLTASFEYELMLTQRWVLSPELELDYWSKDDPQIGIGSGLSEAEFSLRLGYEIRREIMPYIGVSWSRRFGTSADFAAEEGEDSQSTLIVAGLSVWF